MTNSERTKLWRKKNPEKFRAQKIRHRARHLETVRRYSRESARRRAAIHGPRAAPETIKGMSRRIYSKAWYQANAEKIRAATKRHRQSERGRAMNRAARTRAKARDRGLREEILRLLGPRCVGCGFSDVRALQIDHVHGGGGRERRKHGERYYRKVLAALGTGAYQILCANCNWIKGAQITTKREGT